MCKEEKKKQAGSSFIRSTSRSRGHSSCKRHPTFLPQLRQTSRPRLSLILLFFTSSFQFYIHNLLSLYFPPVILWQKSTFFAKAQCQTRSSKNYWCVTVSCVKDDNTIRPDFNNASAAVRPVVSTGADRRASSSICPLYYI